MKWGVYCTGVPGLPGWNNDNNCVGGIQKVTPNGAYPTPYHTFDDWIGPSGAFRNMSWYPLIYVPVDGCSWSTDWTNIIKPHIDYAYAHGGIPIIGIWMMRWTTDYTQWSLSDPPSNWSNASFTAGNHDAMIDAMAASFKADGRVVWIRMFAEMNGTFGLNSAPYQINYPPVAWATGIVVQRGDCCTYSGSFYQAKSTHTTSTGKEPTNTTYWTNLGTLTSLFGASGHNTEATFKAAWDHVVDRFQSGVFPTNNLKFCFDVGSWPSANYGGNNPVTFANIYPTDSNVDSVGFEFYYPGSSSAQILGIYSEILAKVSFVKVITIAEGGTYNADKNAKAAWITAAYSVDNLKATFPRVSSTIMWDSEWTPNELSFMETALIKGAIMACLQEYKSGQ